MICSFEERRLCVDNPFGLFFFLNAVNLIMLNCEAIKDISINI